ncbi:MAG: RDD family protein [Phycisphaeraceae bacterium]
MRPLFLMLCLWMTLIGQAFAAPGAGTDPAPPAPPILAAGDRASLWVVIQQPDKSQLLYRAPDSPPGMLYITLESKGKIVDLAVSQSLAYLRYDTGIFQSVRFIRDADTGLPDHHVQQLPPLPAGVKVIDMNADASGLLVLAFSPPAPAPEAQSPAASSPANDLYQLSDPDRWWFESKPTPAPGTAPGSTETPAPSKPGQSESFPGASAAPGIPIPAPGSSPAPAPSGLAPLTIFRLIAGQWQPLPAPPEINAADLDPKNHPRIASINHQPVLLSFAAGSLTLHQFDGSAWSVQHDSMPLGSDWRALTIDRHLVIVDRQPNARSDGWQLVARLRFDNHWLDAGVMHLPTGKRLDFLPTAYDDQLTVLLASPPPPPPEVISREGKAPAAAAQPELSWLQRDLRGRPDAPVTSVSLKIAQWPTPPIHRDLMVFGLFAVAMLIMVAVWRRDASDKSNHKVKLPPNLVPAGLFRRGIALLIDLFPAWIILYAVLGASNVERILQHWPASVDAAQLYLTFMTLAILTAHVTLSEMLTGRSLGKWIMGCRVVTLTGSPPNVWQVLIRNLIRILELLLWPLLILAVLSPFRQRLGDLAARTVVVRNAKPGETPAPGTPGTPGEKPPGGE